MNVTLNNYHLERLYVFENDITKILNITWGNQTNTFQFLKSIDPYGVTYFSYLQVQNFIIPELLNLKGYEPQITDDIEKLINFLKQISLHQYIKIL